MITYEFIAYAGSIFTDEDGDVFSYSKIKDNFYKYNGRLGKVIHTGHTSVNEQGYSGGYDNYSFVFQDDLTTMELVHGMILETV